MPVSLRSACACLAFIDRFSKIETAGRKPRGSSSSQQAWQSALASANSGDDDSAGVVALIVAVPCRLGGNSRLRRDDGGASALRISLK